jgi:hypothetical protein
MKSSQFAMSSPIVAWRRISTMSSASVLTFLPSGDCLTTTSYSSVFSRTKTLLYPELLYDWRFTANQFVLATSPLRLTTSNFCPQLNTCGHSSYVRSSLTRGRVCHLQLLLVLASAIILRSESHGIHDHILLSQIRDSLNLEGQVPLFISPRKRHWVPFSSPPTTRRAAEEVCDPATTLFAHL